jgi:hypothetical protein
MVESRRFTRTVSLQIVGNTRALNLSALFIMAPNS